MVALTGILDLKVEHQTILLQMGSLRSQLHSQVMTGTQELTNKNSLINFSLQSLVGCILKCFNVTARCWLVSSCVHVISWLCSRVMRFQSRPSLIIESSVVQWLEHPTSLRRVMGSNFIWGSDFFRVLLTLNIMLLLFHLYFNFGAF